MRSGKRYSKNTKLFISTGLIISAATVPFSMAYAESPFTDVTGNTHETAINALAERNILKGYPNDIFKPSEQLSRGHVVKILGRYLVEEGNHRIPNDYKTNMRFTDLTNQTDDELLRYAAVVGDSNVFIGSNGNLNPSSYITREQIALVVMRLFDNHFNINSTAYLESVSDFTSGITDINRASSGAVDAINMVDYFDITVVNEYQPKSPTMRGQFASFIQRLLVKLENPDLGSELEDYKQQVLINPNSLDINIDNKALIGSGARPGTQLTVKDANGNVIGSATVNDDGSYTIPLEVDENTKAPITIEATNPNVGSTDLVYTDIDITDLAGDVGQDGDTGNNETPGSGIPGGSDPGSGTPGGSNPGSGTPGGGNPGDGTPGGGNPGEEIPGGSDPGEETPSIERGTLEALTARAESMPRVETSVDGSDISISKQWTTEEALDMFASAISAAQRVLEDETATQEEINEAVTELTTAIANYERAKRLGTQENEEAPTIERSTLENVLASAESVNLVTTSSDGNDVPTTDLWTTEEALSSFNGALAEAREVLADEEAAQEEINAAATSLTEAIATYERAKQLGTQEVEEGSPIERGTLSDVLTAAEAVNRVTTSADGSDVPSTQQWTTEAALATFEAGIADAREVLADESATQEEINAAVTSLIEAIAAYETAKQFGTEANEEEQPIERGTLEELITRASSLPRVTTSTDGSDVPTTDQWTTAEALNAFEEVIAAAEAVLEDENAIQEEINAAVTSLTEAIAAYETSKKMGTQEESGEPTTVREVLAEALAEADSALVAVSLDGSDVPATEEWTTEEALEVFEEAIELAETVLADNTATEEEIEDATEALRVAIVAYEEAKEPGTQGSGEEPLTGREALQDIVGEAREVELAEVSPDGSDVPTTGQWTTQEEQNAFIEAVEAAEAVLANGDSTDEDIEEATTMLREAIEAYEGAKQPGIQDSEEPTTETEILRTTIEEAIAVERVYTSESGSDVPETEEWTTEEQLDTFNNAISAAIVVLEDTDATQAQIDEAVDNLNTAIEAYEDAKSPGTQASEPSQVNLEALNVLIEEANRILDEEIAVTEDGSGLAPGTQWVTQAEQDAFEEAIADAEAALEADTQTEVDIATANLGNAIEQYEDAKQVSGPNELQAEYDLNRIIVEYGATESSAGLGDIQQGTSDLSYTTLSATLGPILGAEVLSSSDIGASFTVEEDQEFQFNLQATVSGVLGTGSLDLAVYKRNGDGYERVWFDNFNYFTLLGIPSQNKYNFETPYFGEGEYVFVTSPDENFNLNLISGEAITITDTNLRERTITSPGGDTIQGTGTVELEGATVTQVRSLNNVDAAPVEITDASTVVDGQYGELSINPTTGAYTYIWNVDEAAVGQIDRFEYTITRDGVTATNRIDIQTVFGADGNTTAMSVTSEQLPVRFNLVNTIEAVNTVNYNVLN